MKKKLLLIAFPVLGTSIAIITPITLISCTSNSAMSCTGDRIAKPKHDIDQYTLTPGQPIPNESQALDIYFAQLKQHPQLIIQDFQGYIENTYPLPETVDESIAKITVSNIDFENKALSLSMYGHYLVKSKISSPIMDTYSTFEITCQNVPFKIRKTTRVEKQHFELFAEINGNAKGEATYYTSEKQSNRSSTIEYKWFSNNQYTNPEQEKNLISTNICWELDYFEKLFKKI